MFLLMVVSEPIPKTIQSKHGKSCLAFIVRILIDHLSVLRSQQHLNSISLNVFFLMGFSA
jgi:hypothetical protein